MKVINFTSELTDAVFDIQQKAYKSLFDRYQDTAINPYMESKEEVLAKYIRKGTCGYVFIEDEIPVGAVRISVRENMCRISALAVLPEYRNRGIAQAALKEIEKIHSECNCWVLDTILQEQGNCHLYEKLGYHRINAPKKINERLTLVDYKKRKDKVEIWDAYDKDGNKLGYDLFRDEPVPKTVYHVVAEIYVFSRDGRVLVTQRAENKTHPLKWENTGGAILKGETPVQGAVRELKEETGIAVDESQLRLIYTEVKSPRIYKNFIVIVDGCEKITLQKEETIDYKWLPYKEYLTLLKTDQFVGRIASGFMQHIDEIEKSAGTAI